MSLVTHFSTHLKQLPDLAQEITRTSLQVLEDRLNVDESLFKDYSIIVESFVRVWSSSQFISESILKNPELLADSQFLEALLADSHRNTYVETLSQLQISDESELMRALRLFRRREMIRIAWRDLAGWADLNETLADLSALAEICIQFALDFLYQQACKSKGTPKLANGNPFNLVVLGMGKLGAYELNYSSDIDLIFAFAEQGTLPDRQETSYDEFFSRLARSLVKVLDAITADGFVFRTDIRLRPFGDSGPVVMSFEGMENYYQTQAREWERYAMVKVRQVAGDFETGKNLMAMFRPFVYRRYLDYGAIEDLRNLKYKITQELKRQDRMDNIKLGPGGIREIEFIGQVFQLVRGGQEKSLQQRGILSVLKTLANLALMTHQDAQQLEQAYIFLRRVENHIQEYQDKQTHDLPNDPIAQEILAYSLGFKNWIEFKASLDEIRSYVHTVFDQVFALSKQEALPQNGLAIWAEHTDSLGIEAQLNKLGFVDAVAVLDMLHHFKKSASIRKLTAKGAGILDRLMPQLLDRMQGVNNPDLTLKRLLKLFEDVAGRNVYLSLLEENPDALNQLIKLSSASPWICEYLALYPALFDELLDARSLYEPLKKQDLERRLQWQLQSCDMQDIEQFMIALRKFKQINVLKVAAADIMGVIPIMVVSDYLTYIAEVVVAEIVDYAWRTLVQKHGLPPGAVDTVANFGVIGFGKFGGIELSYSSDLDMVFLYDCKDIMAMTDGAKAITCAQFYGRLGQQVRHIMDTRMLSGVLYEVDLRLRPNGDSGLLVSQVEAYETYLSKNAWTWEHQALVRARFIAGDRYIQAQFEAVRSRILCVPRDTNSLKAAVREMREKMRESLAIKEAGRFDLKQSKGGIADIEFIVQFWILAQSSNHPELTTYTDNVRLLDGLQAMNFMTKNIAETLKAAYCMYRDFGHKLVLQGERAVIDESEIRDIKTEVEKIWQDIIES